MQISPLHFQNPSPFECDVLLITRHSITKPPIAAIFRGHILQVSVWDVLGRHLVPHLFFTPFYFPQVHVLFGCLCDVLSARHIQRTIRTLTTLCCAIKCIQKRLDIWFRPRGQSLGRYFCFSVIWPREQSKHLFLQCLSFCVDGYGSL